MEALIDQRVIALVQQVFDQDQVFPSRRASGTWVLLFVRVATDYARETGVVASSEVDDPGGAAREPCRR